MEVREMICLSAFAKQTPVDCSNLISSNVELPAAVHVFAFSKSHELVSRSLLT
jgi:hypothetical protein